MFIKKRKITKASIDELAKRYPQDIISDEDARNIVAGTMYFDMSGAFIARVGSGNDIRICSGGAYSAGEWSGSLQSYFEIQDLMGRLTWRDPNASTAEISKLQYDVQQRLMYESAGYEAATGAYGNYVMFGDFQVYRKPNTAEFTYVYVGPNQADIPSGTGTYVGLNDYNYGDTAGSILNVPDFIKYSQPIGAYSSEMMERIKAANPNMFGPSGGSEVY